MEALIKKADVLLEALPYIKKFHNKIVVIKFGGSSMSDPDIIEGILEDIVFMQYVGMKPVLVHGGGPAISGAMKVSGIIPEFIQGLRVTDRDTMDIVEDVLLHTINRNLVEELQLLGAKAKGVSGLDGHLMEVKKMDVFESASQDGTPGRSIDLGYVGDITKVHPQVIVDILEKGEIPVIAPIGVGADELSYNINGDVVAGEIAAALHAEKLVYLTDVEGILRSIDDSDSLISTMHEQDVEDLISTGVIVGGMIPKTKSCLKALHNGAHKGHIVDGQLSHSLLLEIFTDKGIGTQIIP